MTFQRKNLSNYIPLAILGIVGILLCVMRVQFGLTRFFDVDEFSYLHWAADAAKAQVPYKDFFLFISPGFVWLFAPLFAAMGATAQVFIVARVVAIGIFFGILGLLVCLYGETRSWKWALLPMVILTFLPMPYDKFLELRPDNLGALLALAGLLFEVVALKRRKRIFWVSSGVLYGLALITILKIMPFVAVGVGIAALSLLMRKDLKNLLSMGLGFVVPIAFMLLWSWVSGNFSQMIYLVTRVPFELYLGVAYAPMEPNLFFYPNSSFYGGTGFQITQGLLINHALWLLGIGMGIYRLVTPILTAKKREDIWIELLLAGTFVLSIIGYVKFFPLRHTQYLIPIAIFIAYYAADGLSLFFDWLTRVGGRESMAIVLAGFCFLLYQTNSMVNQNKVYTNAVQLSELTRLQKEVPKNARVFDMEGRMVFWTDAYYICCLPLGFEGSMRYPPPPIIPALATTDYIFQGESNRLSTLSPEAYAYVLANFRPVGGWGEMLWVRK